MDRLGRSRKHLIILTE
ncbi:hypothetical protein [Escherichia coli]